jgi:tetraacyldisaccharide 4'-kinase
MTRGYGGKKSGLVSKSDTAAHVGDEAKMLSSDTPVITGRDRVASAAAAGKMGYKRIIMDDGFQNPTLCKDLSILIFDEKLGIGNGFGIPAGPMRESLTSGIKRCDAVIVIRQNASAKTFFKIPKTANRLKKPVFYSKAKNIDPGLRGRVLAFAGTGYPQKFFDGLREFLKPADARDSEFVPYPDHHVYSDAELEGLSRRAAKHGATLVTTEKDWIKIPPGYQKKIKCVPMDIEIENPFWAWLNEQKKG